MIAEASGKNIENVRKDCERDFWMSAIEAIDYGVIDNIIEKH